MSPTIEDIDDISISGSRVIVAIGARRYLFGNLKQDFTDDLRKHQLEGRLAQSAAVGTLIRKIGAETAVAGAETSAAAGKPARTVLTLSSRTVTIISRRLMPLTSLPVAALLCVASAICLALAIGDGLTAPLKAFSSSIGVLDIVVALATYIASVFVHEFGHAVLCLKKTGLVGAISVRLSRGLPVFATDVSSLHLAGRSDQARIAVAGVLFQTVFASVLMMTPIPAIQVGALVALVAALFSLLPFPRSDGFWFMSDVLGIDLSRSYRDASPLRKALHPYTLWLVSTQLTIWALLFYSGYKALSKVVSDGQLLLSGAALWALYILYAVLVVSSHAVRTIGFLRNGNLSRWDTTV